MTNCRFCDQAVPLVKAHIIPAAFFRVIGSGRDTPLLFTNTGVPFPKRTPIGVYDDGILCDRCERRFDKVDAYGTRILLHTFRTVLRPLRRGNDLVGFEAAGLDQDLLKRFFVATLWRASVSTHPFFARVQLGPHYEELARISVSSLPVPNEFSVNLSRWAADKEHESLVTGLMDPIAERWSGVRGYRFYFGEYVAYIKVDKRPFPNDLWRTVLGAGPKVIVISRNYSTSKDFAAMKKTALGQHQNSLRARQALQKP